MRPVVVAAALLLFLGLQVDRLRQKSNGFDELAYIGQGQLHLRKGRFEMSRWRHPPLAKYISAIPLLFSDVILPSTEGKNAYQFGFEYLYRNTRPAVAILMSSRIPMLVLPVLSALLLFKWGQKITDPWTSLAVTLLVLFEPNFMAHSGLVMSDLCVTTMLLGSSYALWRYARGEGSEWRCWSGIFLGLAFLSKVTALFAVPVFCGVLFSRTNKPVGLRFRDTALDMAVILLLALFLVAIGYRITEIGWWFREVADRICESHDPLLASPKYGSTGISTIADPLGYLQKCIYKCSLLFLLGLVGSGLLVSRVSTSLKWFVLGIPAFFLGSTLIISTQSAVRYILPAFPFLVLPLFSLRGRIQKSLIAVLAITQIGVAIHAHPHYLTHTNVLYQEEGLPIFSGSEYDFGQDLPALQKFMEDKPQASLILCYFGLADPSAYGLRVQWLPSYPVRYQEPNPTINPLQGQQEFLAVSVTSLQGHPDRVLINWLDRLKPVSKPGKSIWVWDITQEPKIHEQLMTWYERYGWAAHADRERRAAHSRE